MMNTYSATQAANDVLAERKRQVEGEGWTPEHDDAHEGGELAAAASCYAIASTSPAPPKTFAPGRWPWKEDDWKPTDRRRMLVKAGALVLAEIERLDRAALRDESDYGAGDGVPT